MPATNGRRDGFARSGASGDSRLVLCVFAFVATGAAVLWMKASTAPQATQYSATATIWHGFCPLYEGKTNHPTRFLLPDASAVQQQILSANNLQQAVRRLRGDTNGVSQGDLSAAVEPTIDEVRQNLRVTAKRTSSPDRLQITIAYTADDPKSAVELVNALAERYAQQHQANPATAARQDYVEARDAAERARREYFEAKGRFDDFIQQHFLKQQTWAERAAKRTAEPRSARGLQPDQAAEATKPRIAANPERVALEAELAGLEQQRARLLVARTPMHPEVRDVDARITLLKQRLASIPDLVPRQQPGALPSEHGPALSGLPEVDRSSDNGGDVSDTGEEIWPTEAVSQLAEAVQAFHDHKEAMNRAREEYDRLSETKRRAWEAQLRSPNIELELAETCEVWSWANDSPRPLLVALSAAMAVAFGVGLIWSGFDTDLPLRTPAEAETALAVPVVGKIAATDPSQERTPKQRRPPATGLAKIIYGVLLIAVCFGVLVAVL